MPLGKEKLRIGLYGTNGHQITSLLVNHPRAEVVAVAGFAGKPLPDKLGNIATYEKLDDLLADPRVDLVSICSPRRADQAVESVKALKAGKHVYAEKPSALKEEDLDRILTSVEETGLQYHEMGGIGYEPPYDAVRECVASGAVGEVVQVLAQKSYPWHDRRPGDEDVDGGLSLQVGVYPVRFIEHVAGVRITSMALRETCLGNDHVGSGCRRAVSMLFTLANGGVASAICNYLNPVQHLAWGYEILRVFGTQGIAETNALNKEVRLLKPGETPVLLNSLVPGISWLDRVIAAILDGTPMPLTTAEQLSPTRWCIRAKQEAAASGMMT